MLVASLVLGPAGRRLLASRGEDAGTLKAHQKLLRRTRGRYLFDSRELWHALDRVQNDNAQGEYYITDAPGILKAEGKDVRALCALAACETLSVNTADELGEVERELAKNAKR